MRLHLKEVEFDILYNEGISKTGDLIDLATNFGILKKSGSWFTYGEDRFQGRDQVKQKLIENPDMYKSLEKDVKAKLGMEVKEGNKAEEKTSSKKSGK